MQLSIYRRILNTLYFPGRFTDELLLLNFVPKEPEAYYLYHMTPMDLDPLWNIYLPWRSDAAVHHQFPIVSPYVPYIEDSDPRCWDGPTKCTRLPRRDFLDPLLLDTAIWTQKAVTSPGYPPMPASDLWSHPNRRWFGTPTPDVYASYEEHLLNTPSLLRQLPTLIGRSLWCWCGDGPENRCNAEALVKWANLLDAGAFTLPPLSEAEQMLLQQQGPLPPKKRKQQEIATATAADSILTMPVIKDEAF